MNRQALILLRDQLLKKIAELQIELAAKQDLRPLLKRAYRALEEDMALLGHPIRMTEGYRSRERQAQLYAQGRTTPGQVVTKAKPGESLHNYGVAFDIVFRKEGYGASQALWQTVGSLGRKHGLEWGGDWTGFKDMPHFQIMQGYTLADFKSGKVDYNKYK